jgi:hypothetical protein
MASDFLKTAATKKALEKGLEESNLPLTHFIKGKPGRSLIPQRDLPAFVDI